MDLKQRIEELTALQESLQALRAAKEEEAKAREAYNQADQNAKKENDVIVSDIERRNVELLQHRHEAAKKRAEEAATKFTELREKTVEAVHQDVNAELELYRESGEEQEMSVEDRMRTIGTPYGNVKDNVQRQNLERRSAVYRMEEKLEEHQKEMDDVDKRIDEALAQGADDGAIKKLEREKAAIGTKIKRVQMAIKNFSQPFKSMEENEAEYNKLYEIWKSMEDIMDPDKQDVLVETESIEATINAIKELGDIQEAAIPAQVRYDALKDQKADLQAKKAEAKEAIENIKKGLANGTIKGQYVETSKARLAELEAEVAEYEAQEKECAAKMEKLEKEEGIKPEATPMEQYEAMENLKKQTEQQIAEKTADLEKIKAELAAHPEKAEELKAKQAQLESELAVLEKGKSAAEARMTELNDKYKLGQDIGKGEGAGKGEGDGAGKGEGDGTGKGEGDGTGKGEGDGSGKGEGDGAGKPKTPQDELKEVEAEFADVDSKVKKLNAEINAKKQLETIETDPDKRKALGEELKRLTDECAEATRKQIQLRGKIGSLTKQIKAEEEAKKAPKPVPIIGDEYYESKGIFGKAKLKAEAFEAATGTKPGFFKRMLLALPSNEYSKKAADMLTAGQIKPIAGDEELIKEAAEKRAADAAAAEAAKAGKGADPFATLTPEQKAEAEKAAREAAAKAGEAKAEPAKDDPAKDSGDAR